MNYSLLPGPINCSPILNSVEKRNGQPAGSVRFTLVATLLLLIGACCATSCSTGKSSAAEAEATPHPALNPIPSEAPPTPFGDRKIAEVLNSLLDSMEYSTARWGMEVVSLKEGKVLYQRNGNRLFTPASNMKVYTTAVALDLLGADYRWRTSVYADSEPDANGVIHGDLVLYGRGAPDLVSTNRRDNQNSLEELANALAKRGVKHVAGNVIGDESYFRGEPIGQGWQWNDLQWYFGAEASALSINGNSTEVSISQPEKPKDQPVVATTDQTGFVQLRNSVASVDRGNKYRLGIQRGLSDNSVTVWGEMPVGVPGYGASLSVHKPAAWAARLFVKALTAHGISVEGSATSRDWRSSENERFDPKNKNELALSLSKSLGEIVRTTNKNSVNLYAELILRTLGRERAAMLGPDENPNRERGDEEAGAELVRLWLTRSGVKMGGLAMYDGSGLSRLDLVSPESTVGLLRAIHRTASGQVFLDSLPIAATDGTLGGRLPELKGRVAAKTGTLTYDHSLAGYLTGDDGQVLVFAVMCNDFLEKNGATRLIDQLVTALSKASSPSFPLKNKEISRTK